MFSRYLRFIRLSAILTCVVLALTCACSDDDDSPTGPVTPSAGPQIVFVTDRDGNSEIYAMDIDGGHTTNLTNNAAEDVDAAWSPDSTRIAFSSDRVNGQYDIYVMATDGSSQIRISFDGSDDRFPVWSPDSKYLAFLSDRNGNWDIYVRELGVGLTQVTGETSDASIPSWSPDGLKLAYLSGDNLTSVGSLYTVYHDGTDATAIADDAQYGIDLRPVWSPDGSRIAFTRDHQISTVPATGGALRQLTNIGSNYFAQWSPDGARLVYYKYLYGNREIYSVDSLGQHEWNLSNNAGSDERPCYTPDGSRIMFLSDRDGYIDIWSMGIGGSNPINLTNSTSHDTRPSFKQATFDPSLFRDPEIVFQSDRDGNDEIYVMDADGSHQVNLTNNAARDRDPVWSPDGTRIAFASNRTGGTGYEIFVMNADGSGLRQVTSATRNNLNPVWSPDGTRLAFRSNRDNPPNVYSFYEVYTVRSDGSQLTRITYDSSTVVTMAGFSANSAQVAYGVEYDSMWDRGSLYLSDVNGSNRQLLFDTAYITWNYGPVFSPDGSEIAFVGLGDNGYLQAFTIGTDGSNPTNLVNASSVSLMPRWSPDGSRIAYFRGACSGSLVYVMNADGSLHVPLTPAGDQCNCRLDWSPDGSRIVFDRQAPGGRQIYVANSYGSGSTNLTESTSNEQAPDWRPGR